MKKRSHNSESWEAYVQHALSEVHNTLRAGADQINRDPEDAAYAGAAYLLMKVLISKDIAEQYLQPPVMHGVLSNMAVTIGETLYALRDSPCLAEFCDRIETRRDVRSSFYEAFAARLFLDIGCFIIAVGESGVKGRDFDFTALVDGTFVSVEVTCLQKRLFSLPTLKNALEAKAKQLPSDSPGAICVVLPEGWFDAENAIQLIRDEVTRLFRVSKRVNMVLLLSEENTEITTGLSEIAMLQYRVWALFNKDARNVCEGLFFFRALGFGDEGRDLAKDPRLTNENTQADLKREIRDRPFFAWVDEALGRVR